MKDIIYDVINGLKIKEFIITETETESAELFFIKKKLDIKRMKDNHRYNVHLYRAFEENGRSFKGDSEAVIYPGMTEQEVRNVISGAYLAASFVKNDFYELVQGEKREFDETSMELSRIGFKQACGRLTEALFASDVEGETGAFLNSAELFVNKNKVFIYGSTGIDAGYERWRVEGEFVTQCKIPQDVEIYNQFAFDELKEDALREKVENALKYTKARAQAVKAPSAGNYNVIICGDYMKDFFSYYLARSNAQFIHCGFSSYKVGDRIMGAKMPSGTDNTGDLLSLTLKAEAPVNSEGIIKKDRLLVKDGVLQCIYGNTRFSYYLGVEPTGAYKKIEVEPGTADLEQLLDNSGKEPWLWVVTFSDFQMDPLSGFFGGEIRLAFLHEGDKVTPLTGGSINGNLIELQDSMRFSTKMTDTDGYHGPYAVFVRDVSVAGDEE